jgi:hypothetical protein
MRSLEKVAYDKGWVKPEPITKQASKKESLAPTNNLMTNVLKLCAGLRTQGMEKYADELETCFLNYKRAQTMYDAHGEKGEDVIHAAHPKGSHKMEDIDSSEAVFEDILDQHVKIMQVMDKKPSGKLSTAREIIDGVRVVLGQDANEEQEDALLQDVKVKMQSVNSIMNSFFEQIQSEVTVSADMMKPIIRIRELTEIRHPKKDDMLHLKKVLEDVRWRFKPGILMGISADTWDTTEPLIDQSLDLVDKAMRSREGYLKLIRPSSHVQEKVVTPVKPAVPTNQAAPTTTGTAQQLPVLYNEITQSITASKTKAQTLPNGPQLSALLDKALQFAKSTFETGFQQSVNDPTVAQTTLNKLMVLKNRLSITQQKYSI